MDHVQIRREFHESGGVRRGLVEVDDDGVVWVLRIDREVDRAGHFFIARLADVDPLRDIDARDFPPRDGGTAKRRGEHDDHVALHFGAHYALWRRAPRRRVGVPWPG